MSATSEVVKTKVVHDDGKVEDRTFPVFPDYQASGKQFAMAQAAQEALDKGEDPVKAAEKVAEEVAKQTESEGDLAADYLLCVCQLGHGKFEGLHPSRLAKIAALVESPIRPFQEWALIARGLQK